MTDAKDSRPLVLVVEDEPEIARVLLDYLQAQYRTHWLSGGADAVDWVRSNRPAMVLLDLMLPDKSGTDICREIRQFSGVPIIMVTAKVEEIDRLLGLELGADDYVCKPFYPREVVARIKRILDRVAAAATPGKGAAIALDIDESTFRAQLDGKPLDLTPVEFRLLAALASPPGHVLSRDQLMDRIYPDHRVVSDRTIDTHVRNLRAKMLVIRPGDEIIHSVYSVGYRLEV